jgi:dihydrofolate reductase
MGKLVYGMNQSLDGYVNHDAFAPGPKLFRHFIEQAGRNAASLYGRGLYELMKVWDDDIWQGAERDFAEAWRGPHKYVVSHTLKSVGPNASLLEGDLATAVRELKSKIEGTIEVGGPNLARSLTDLGLIDEYVIYLHPVVLGSGAPYFVGPRPRLRLTGTQEMGEDVVRLTYVPA